MRRLDSYADSRTTSCCAHCGGPMQTRDHAPSKVLLDQPYPPDLPLVPACSACNEGFSLDEEYLACLLECVIRGSTRPDDMARENISRKLATQPALAARIEKGRRATPEGLVWDVEQARVDNVLIKLAQAHAFFELADARFDSPPRVSSMPLQAMSPELRDAFENPPGGLLTGWPEVGSRAMQRLVEGDGPWLEVQPGRYRYMAHAGPPAIIRIVLSEYLAAEVTWDDD